jgi:hypothetical protein
VTPTTQLSAAVAERRAAVGTLLQGWSALRKELGPLNGKLKAAGLAEVKLE